MGQFTRRILLTALLAGVSSAALAGLPKSYGIGQGWPMAGGQAAPVQGGGAPRIATSNVVIIAGDSTATTTGPYSGALNALRADSGWMVWARQLLKGQIDWNRALVIGQGGITTTTFIANFLPALLAAIAENPGCSVILSLSLNDTFDTNSVTTPTALANIDTILDAITAAGANVHFSNTWPSTGPSWNATKAHAIRDYYRAKNNPVVGRYLVESYSTCSTVPDGDTFKTDYIRTDGVHLAPLGGQAIGRLAAANMASTIVANDISSSLVWLNTADFAGSVAISGPANISGVLPTGFNAVQTAIASGSIVCSKINEGGEDKIQLLLTDVANGSSAALATLNGLTGFNAGFTAGVDKVDSMVRVEVLPHPTSGLLSGLAMLRASNRRNGGQFLPSLSDPGSDASYAGSTTDYVFGPEGFDVYLRPPAFTLTAGATQLYGLWLDLAVARNQVGNCLLKISRVKNRIKTSLTEPG